MNRLSPRFAIEDIADEDYKMLMLLLADPESELELTTNDITTVTRIDGFDILGRKVCKQIVAYLKGGKHVLLDDMFNVSINFNIDKETMAVFLYEAKRYIVADSDAEFFDNGGDEFYSDGGNEFESDDMSDDEYLDLFRDELDDDDDEYYDGDDNDNDW